jgi:hypothetical protein
LGEYIAEAVRSIHLAWQEVTMESIFHDTVFQRFYETHNHTQLGKYGEQNKVVPCAVNFGTCTQARVRAVETETSHSVGFG